MNIRRLTPEERARNDEAEGMRYEVIEAEIKQAEQDEYEREFGDEFRKKYPFKPSKNLHEKVMARIAEEYVGLDY